MLKLEEIVPKYKSVYVIDLSWMLHRYFAVFKNLSMNVNGYARPTGHIYGVLNAVKQICEFDRESVIFVTQDGVPVEREEVMAESGDCYKDGRPELEFNFYSDIPIIKAACCYLSNVYWAYNDDKECDDEMYAIVKQSEKLFDGKCYVYSGDNDLLQAIDDRTSVIRNKTQKGFEEITDEVVKTDEKFVKKFHGVDTAHITHFRAIVGDSSDKIKGIPRFPRDVAVSIAMSYDGDRCTFIPVTSKEKKYFDLYKQNKELLSRNYKIMKLRDDYEVNIEKPVINSDKLMELLDKFGLSSYKRFLLKEA